MTKLIVAYHYLANAPKTELSAVISEEVSPGYRFKTPLFIYIHVTLLCTATVTLNDLLVNI
jgi:hypothetical protein